MLRLRLTTEFQPRTKNGQPAHRTTGVASMSCSQLEACCPEQHVKVGQMTAHLERNHRNRQRQPDPEPAGHVGELGIGPESAVTVSGSSAMPQIGQEPGPTWRICGCIGQV